MGITAKREEIQRNIYYFTYLILQFLWWGISTTTFYCATIVTKWVCVIIVWCVSLSQWLLSATHWCLRVGLGAV